MARLARKVIEPLASAGHSLLSREGPINRQPACLSNSQYSLETRSAETPST